MVTIITHGDGDGICSAALVKMVKRYHNAKVFFSHPMGLNHDFEHHIQKDDLVICDIAVDDRAYEKLCKNLTAFIEEGYSVVYIDHHFSPGPLPEKVIHILNFDACATELTFRYFFKELPCAEASRIALIGAINDYMDYTPFMSELRYEFERRSLFLDAGILAQALNHKDMNYKQKKYLVNQFGTNKKYPCEIEDLVKKSIEVTKSDKIKHDHVLQNYKTMENIAYIMNPSAPRSKAAHWIMGHTGKPVGMCLRIHNWRKDIVDITIRGRKMINLREIVVVLARKMGGSGGGHPNACGARIPVNKLDEFLKKFNDIIGESNIKIPTLDSLI